MAAYRPIHISYWQDKFILKLTPEQKYFYLYLMTNSKTKQCGIYELPKNVICFETGYNQETINKLLTFFIDSKKILYDDDTEEIFIKNWVKFNQIDNKNIAVCVLRELKEVKSKIFLAEFVKCITNINVNELYNNEIKGLVRGLVDPTKKESKEEEETESKEEEETESKTLGSDFENLIPPVLKTIEFEIVWNEWIKYKSEIRNKVTESTAKKQLQFLEIHKENAIDIINQSIQSGWKGLFELNNKFNQNGTVKPRRNTLQDF